jgi:adenylate kinase
LRPSLRRESQLRLVLIGRGTGFEAWQLAEQLALPHLSVGAMVRKHVEDQSPLGQQLSAALSAGHQVPTNLVRQMIAAELNASAASSGWLLEGFPRTSDDARWLDSILEQRRTPITAALISDTPEATGPELEEVIAYYGDRSRPSSEFFS